MAPQVTEICYITLKPGVSLEDSSPAAETFKGAVSTLQQQDGFQSLYYGLAIENPNLLILFINWQTLSSHEIFMQTPSYQPFLKGLNTILDSVHLRHFISNPSPPAIIATAPVIEFATFFKIHDEFPSSCEKFCQSAGRGDGKGEGWPLGWAFGPTIEEVGKHGDIGKEGEEEGKGKGFVLLGGWESVEAHMEFRKTKLFEENVGLIRGNHGGVEMFHVAFKGV